MASIILRDVGSAVGNSLLPGIGGAFLGTLGRSLGGLVDSKLGLGASYQGPQLQNLSVQDSRYGAGMPVTYGTMRVAGNVIWSTDLMQTQHSSSFSGGKGGGNVSATTYTYSVHCAVGIAQGPIGGITTIWADSNIVYQDGVWVAGTLDSATIYTGAASQMPDAFMESILGSGSVPAYRGLAYIVLENLQLANFGNRLPNLTFEIAPAVTTANPSFLGSVDAGVSVSPAPAQAAGIAPLVLTNNGSGVGTLLIGGYVLSGSTCTFEVVEYDVTGETPVELARAASASFAANNPVDISWALGPDNRTVALYLENGSVAAHFVALYDIETQQFGTVFAPMLAPATQTMRQPGWLDAQHFVVDNIVGGARGVEVFARAGMDIVDLGFTGIWGAGSGTSRLFLSYAQFLPFAGGLLALVTDNSGGNYFTAIYACTLAWRSNALVAGTPYIIASGLTTGTGSDPHANIVQTGGTEWTLCFATVLDYHLISFEPGASSATVTRPWQDFSFGFGTGTTTFPLYYGDRLVMVQRSSGENFYRLSEVMLGSGSFSQSLAPTPVSGGYPYGYFTALALDNVRFLLACIGGTGFDIQQFGIFERCATSSGLDAVMTDILTRAGYAGGDFDVSSLAGVNVDGYVLQGPMTARSAIEPLQVFYPFDLIESAGMLKAIPRGGSAVATIPSSEWRAAPDKKEPPPPLEITRAQQLDLPREIDIDYIDAARDFEINSQRARRIGVDGAQAIQSLALPIVIDSDTAKQIAEVRLYSLWAERELVQLSISRAWLAVDPGDVIDLGNGDQLRITQIDEAGGLLQVQGFYVTEGVYASLATADTGQVAARPQVMPVASALYMMDIPLLQATDDQPGVYAAATGLPGWNGASLWRSADGVNYNNIATFSSAAGAGIAVTALGAQSCLYMDGVSTVNVQLMQGALSSCTLTDLYNGANAALLGNEIIQFETATLIGSGLYTLSNLLRGRRGTEFAAGNHVIGENFALLTADAVEFVPALLADRGQSYDFRALTNGQSLGDAQDTFFTYGLAAIRPFSPVNLAGIRANGASGDLTLTWNRRARLNAEWVDYIDVPLDEPAELYDVEIMNGSAVMRTFYSVTSPTVIYTVAEQTADWGSGIPSSFTINVYQISSRYGRGEICTAVI